MESTRRKKILIIEDDAFMTELLAGELETSGIKALVAKTGAEGLIKFETDHPDLVLLDIMLPDQTGFETLRHIRRSKEGPQAKIVILSNVGESRDIEEAKRFGVSDYLIKANFTLPEVVVRIKQVLAR